jgi:L-lactate utilization protein LutB
LRESFLQADIGLTGCNFAVAESGSIVLVSNEGNARLTTTLPRTHVVMMGMERIVPSWADLDAILSLLPRSATGQKSTSYVTAITGPKKKADCDGPESLHVVIVDNGRSNALGTDYEEILNCIRCGSCLNVCPVYRQIGGHAYGSVYPGPIGAVLTPILEGFDGWEELPYASSLCGACTEACPVKIPLHDMLIDLRSDEVTDKRGSRLEKLAFQSYAALMKRPKLYSWSLKAASWASHALATELTAGLTELGISPRAHCVLSKAMGNELTQSQLAGLCALDKTTMVVTIDELERGGLAERRLSSTDRRARIIFVTEAGEQMVERGREIVARIYDDVLGSLPEGEREAFVGALARLVNGRLATPVHCERPVRRPRATSQL